MPRVTISEPGNTPQPYQFQLERRTISIGRGSDNDITVECGSTSTKHCVIERVDGGYIMRDMDSTNGIRLDDTPMEIIDLVNGMEVLIGDVACEFRLSDDEIETLAGEEFTTYQKKKLPPVRQEAYEQAPAAPTPAPASAAQSPLLHISQSGPAAQQSGGALKTLLFLILVLLAIFAGMTIRHHQRTDELLPEKLLKGKKEQAPQKPATEPEATTDAPGDTETE